mgnify:CR=1 FL=1
MISIIITAFKEPTIRKTIDSIVNQNIVVKHEIIVVSPDEETKKIVHEYSKRYPNLKYLKDPGKGKSYALNLVFKKIKSEIFILTDGDVILGEDSINEIIKYFNDSSVGVVAGRVLSSNQKDEMFGYWSHLLADAGAHNIRKELSSKNEFLECSAYLFAFRNIIEEIPLNVAEDAYIPYLFWQKGYKIKYSENAKVYVKNPTNFKDWMKQRTRTSKAHENLNKYVDTKFTPRVKSFSNEIRKGFFRAWKYPKNTKEYYWTFILMFARLYMWSKVFLDTKFLEKEYTDAWERIESTKT